MNKADFNFEYTPFFYRFGSGQSSGAVGTQQTLVNLEVPIHHNPVLNPAQCFVEPERVHAGVAAAGGEGQFHLPMDSYDRCVLFGQRDGGGAAENWLMRMTWRREGDNTKDVEIQDFPLPLVERTDRDAEVSGPPWIMIRSPWQHDSFTESITGTPLEDQMQFRLQFSDPVGTAGVNVILGALWWPSGGAYHSGKGVAVSRGQFR